MINKVKLGLFLTRIVINKVKLGLFFGRYADTQLGLFKERPYMDPLYPCKMKYLRYLNTETAERHNCWVSDFSPRIHSNYGYVALISKIGLDRASVVGKLKPTAAILE